MLGSRGSTRDGRDTTIIWFMTEEPWPAGGVVVLQELWRGKLWDARPLTVVQDHDDSLALWIPEGTRYKLPTTPSSRPKAASRAVWMAECMVAMDWELSDRHWDGSSLYLMQPGKRYAVWVSWKPLGHHSGWKVNFQEPYRRIGHSIQTMDLMLDLVIEPSGEWRWKDEDEAEIMMKRGLLKPETVEGLRSDAETLLAMYAAEEGPFHRRWLDWTPDPAWSAPVLPANWDQVL